MATNARRTLDPNGDKQRRSAWAPGRPPLGSFLKARGLVTEAQLVELQRRCRETGKRLGQLIVEAGLASEIDVAQALAAQSEYPFVNLEDFKPDPEVLRLVPREIALQHGVLPIKMENGRLLVAPVDPYDLRTDEAVRSSVGVPVSIVVAPERQIRLLLQQWYGFQVPNPAERPSQGVVVEVVEDEPPVSLEKLAALSREMSTIQVLNSIISEAIAARASDIHLQPAESMLRVRYRIDGRLHTAVTLPKSILLPLVTRIKVMCSLDIAESRRPQDGSCRLRVNSQVAEMRVSTLPGIHGEAVVIRLLNQRGAMLQLDQIGLAPAILAATRRLLRMTSGMVLVTGPTGSGKSTTVYAILRELNDGTKSIITVEDPVEFQLHGATQVQVNEKAGLTFSTTLRAMLRHDPDVLVVGEIRDAETAEIAARCAITGHLVVSTLHTNYAAITPTRLLDMGVPAFMISASLNCVLAQRLAGLVCERCAEPVEPPPLLTRTLAHLKVEVEQRWRRGRGCATCYGTGMRGRLGIHELLEVDDEIRGLVAERAPTSQIFLAARRKGMLTLFEDACVKAAQGLIPPEEAVSLATSGSAHAAEQANDGSAASAEYAVLQAIADP